MVWRRKFQAETPSNLRRVSFDTSLSDGYLEEGELLDQDFESENFIGPIECSSCDYRFTDGEGDPVSEGDELAEALSKERCQLDRNSRCHRSKTHAKYPCFAARNL